MRRPLSQPDLQLSDGERITLERLAATSSGRSPEARRAQIILLLADGKSAEEIRHALACSTQTIAAWHRRFLRHRMRGLRRARSPQIRTW